MGAVPVVLPDGTTGTVDKADVPHIGEGGRVLTPEEHNAAQTAITERDAPVTAGGLAEDYGESILAGEHALQRGIGEAVGVPLDRGITGIADIVGGDGTRRSTARYLRDLDKRHPLLTAATGIEGNVAGALGAAVALKAPGAIGQAPIAGMRGYAARAAYGGIENVVQATTKDVNEAALGDHRLNGEKLLAAAPERFLIGGILTGTFEAGAHGLGAGIAALRGRAVPALEAGASRVIGREMGVEGDEALAAGERVRALGGGEVPRGRAELGSLLEGEQASQLARAGEEHAGIVSALEGRQATDAAKLTARQEAARKAVHASGEASLEGADRAASDSLLDSLAKGGERVEGADLAAATERATVEKGNMDAVLGAAGSAGARVEKAELAGAARVGGAREEAFNAYGEALAAGERASPAAIAEAAQASRQELEAVTGHYEVLRKTVAEERTAALEAANALKQERLSNASKLQEAIAEAERHSGIAAKDAEARAAREVAAETRLANGDARLTRAEWDDILETQLAITGHSTDPNARWAFEEVLRKEYGEPIDAAEILAKRIDNLEVQASSKAATEKLSRLRSLSDQLKVAHEDALSHLGTVEKASADLEKQAAKDIAKAEAQAEAHAASLRSSAENQALAKGKASDSAHEKVRLAEEEAAKTVETARAEGLRRVEAAQRAAETRSGHARIEADARVETVRAKQAEIVEKARVKAEADVAAARASVKAERESFEASATKERGKLAKLHEGETKKLPKVRETTDVDPLIAGLKKTGAERSAQPMVSSGAGLGAMFSLLHGNPYAAAASLAGSFAAGRARAAGNLTTARALHGLADQISKVDDAVRSGTALILGRHGARAAGAANNELGKDTPKKTASPSFDEIAKDLVAAQSNPAILERRVQAALGPIAKEAPQTYGQTLAATQRAHSFLLSILPPPQRDPHSLTPQLDTAGVDATSQYEFMQSYGTVIDPLSIYKDVHDKSVTEQQVLAIETVFPQLYSQMQDEVNRQKMYLKSPIDYERSIHVGTLLGVITDEVLEPDFQATLTNNYKDKADQEASPAAGSKPSESKTAKSMMSGSESIEGGTP